MDRRSLLEWFPVINRYGGILGVVFVAVVWLVTNRFEPGLLAFFGGMIGLGEGVDALKDLSRRPLNGHTPKKPDERTKP